ncbi:MAG: replication-associated recombination protein A, partial [Bdellovibrionales bacterium]|nr:replication-associated recombination protein A [Bdellovibrionales bacterium]
MRPQDVEEILGQDGAIGIHSSIRKLIGSGRIPSMIIWGPPGCGKTTFARTLQKIPNHQFQQVNAVETGAKQLREIGVRGGERRRYYGDRLILFVDEIHRLNKSQQDVLLPFVESGDVILVGATTENPSFEVNSALLSRCRLIKFEKLSVDNLRALLRRACIENGLQVSDLFNEDAIEQLVQDSDGDARRLLSTVEILQTHKSEGEAGFPLSAETLKKFLNEKSFIYSKSGDMRFDLISAFIKSIRGSSADGAIYYLARMIEAGEDVNFIARRLVISASEDVGNADPNALVMATSGQQAVHLVGLPEAGIILAQVVTYLSTAPKSNRSYSAYKEALQVVKDTGNLDVPMSIRNSPTQLLKDLGAGEGYQYAHDFPKGFAPEMSYLPKAIESKKF